ncbi:MAG: DUF885 domain-containing protein [Lachnospiraceae bacterium]
MKHKHFLRALSLLMTTVLLFGCVGCAGKTDSGESAFSNFLNELFVEEVTCDSITLNYTLAHPENYGITEHEIGYGSTDLKELDDTSELVEDINKLKSFNREKLSSEEQLDYDILLDYMTTCLEYSDLYLYDKTLSPTIGLNCQLPVVLAEYSFRTKEDVTEYITLLESTDTYFEYILKIEKMKSEKGLFMSDDIADKVIEQCNNFTQDPENNYLIEIFNDKIDAMEDYDDAQRKELKEKNKSAILEHVIPAYTLLANGLTELKGTGQYEGGLCNYPDGDKYYEYLVLSGTGSKRSIDEMENLIDSYMTRGFREMGSAMRKDGDILEKATTFSFGMSDPYEILDDLQERINTEFPKLPDTNFTIKYVHSSLEDHMSPAFYMIPAIDDYKENVIYINRGSNGSDDIYTTLAHEGFPGHLYQTVYTNSKGITPIRSLISYPGYTEGWATYVELLSYEMGAVDQNMGAFMRANQLITLGIYAKCDIGVNYHGWMRDDVEEYITSLFGELEDSVIDEIYQAMVSEPANYLKYVIGGMEFLELRKTAESTLGDKFDPVAFHDFIMTIGPAPFSIISDRMDTWMTTVK